MLENLCSGLVFWKTFLDLFDVSFFSLDPVYHFKITIIFGSVEANFKSIHTTGLFLYYIPYKQPKTRGFQRFSGCVERDQWHEMDYMVPPIWSTGGLFSEKSGEQTLLGKFVEQGLF